LLVAFGSAIAPAVFGVQEVERTALPPTTKVETRTYQQDGKTVTERVSVTTVKEREVVSNTNPGVYKAAIFVSNRAGKGYDDKVAPLEDYITTHVTDEGVSVISRETALNAVGKLDPGATENALDAQLAQSTSAVRLAQSLGADYLLQVTLTGFDSAKRSIDAYGVKAVNEERTLHVSYKVLDGTTGASLTADTIKVSKLVQQSAASTEDHSDVLNELLNEAAGKVAVSLKARIDEGRIPAPAAAQSLATVTIQTEAADLVIPDVRIGVENTVTLSESKFKVTPLSVIVEVDGIAMGTAPGAIQVKPGLSKLRVTREGFKPWERTVNFVNGQTLTVALEMSEAGYARWKESTAFLNGLKNGAKLTDAEVKVLKGKAKMFEQSGFKVDTKEAPKIETHSIFGGLQ
jgi:hypothetical protein